MSKEKKKNGTLFTEDFNESLQYMTKILAKIIYLWKPKEREEIESAALKVSNPTALDDETLNGMLFLTALDLMIMIAKRGPSGFEDAELFVSGTKIFKILIEEKERRDDGQEKI